MAYTDREDLNYLGQLYLVGANQTPFLNMIGGLTGGAKTSASFNFPLAQTWAARAGDQSTAVKSEATSITDVNAITYTRTQDFNTCQIMKYPYEVSFAKQSTYGEISGVAIANGDQPVRDELAFQRAAAMKQLAIDLEFSGFQGHYVEQSVSSTVATTRGLIEACEANTVPAGTVALTLAHINALLLEMSANGAEFENMVLFCNGFQKQAISNLFGYAPEDRNVGGVNVKQLETDFCQLGVVWAPQMKTDTILVADMAKVSLVFCPWKGQLIADVPEAVTTAKEGGFLYTQVGLDYGPEEMHGTITGLTTS
ncbi:MAG: DUF5309 family protein [Phycisphaerae bacterium]|jgi:hypothetical protein